MPALLLILIRLGRAVWAGLKDPEFRGLLLLVIIILVTGAWFYHVREGWSWLDSLYFTVITLTTVGYGDFSPQTVEGKIFTMVYILLGLGIISSFILLVAEHQRGDQPAPWQRIVSRRAESTRKEEGSDSA